MKRRSAPGGKRVKPNGGGDSGPRPFAPIGGEDEGEIVLISAADIKPEAVNWLWPNGLQLGVLNLLAGRSASGKSTIALSWSATITSGGQWPDGQTGDPARVVYWSGEDGIKDTLLPRFIAAGGDRGKCPLSEACAPTRANGRLIPRPTCRSSPARSRSSATCG